MISFHSLSIGQGKDKYDLPKGAHLLIDRKLRGDKLDIVPITDKQLLNLIAKGAAYLASRENGARE